MSTKLRFAGSGATPIASRNLAMFQVQQYTRDNPEVQIVKTIEYDMTVRTGNRMSPVWPLHMVVLIVAEQPTPEEQAQVNSRPPEEVRPYYDGPGPVQGDYAGYAAIVCPWCTRPFHPRGSRQKFCNEEHRLLSELESVRARQATTKRTAEEVVK